MVNLLGLLHEILEVKSYKEVAKYLNVAVGTVKRWCELENVPKSYCFEIMKLSGIEIDYSEFSFKEKDQFYTPPDTANYCIQKAQEIISSYDDNIDEYTYIEPSAGSGNFYNLLPKMRKIGIDIEPNGDGIISHDYLEWKPTKRGKYVVIGNPPFGLRGQLALKFINHSSFAEYVCFILPQLFESDGKGVPRKRVKNFNLVHSEKIHTNFIEPDGRCVKIECIFQVWSKNHKNKTYEIKELDESILKIYSLSDGGTPSTTRNKKMFYKCDIYIPSTTFGKENMRYYTNFDKLPRRKGYGIVFHKNKKKYIKRFKDIKWCDVAFLSTNSAYNIRTSQIASQFI